MKDFLCLYTILIFIVAILGMIHRNYIVRLLVLIVTFSSCCYLTNVNTSTRVVRRIRGHLNMYLGHPYEELFHHLAKLSVEDPEELKKAVLVLSEDKNVALFRDTWLFYHDTGYAVVVQQLIAKGCTTNQVMNMSRQNE